VTEPTNYPACWDTMRWDEFYWDSVDLEESTTLADSRQIVHQPILIEEVLTLFDEFWHNHLTFEEVILLDDRFFMPFNEVMQTIVLNLQDSHEIILTREFDTETISVTDGVFAGRFFEGNETISLTDERILDIGKQYEDAFLSDRFA